MRLGKGLVLGSVVLAGWLAAPAAAQGSRRPPVDPRDGLLKLVRLDQKLNHSLPQELVFRDQHGKEVHLRDFYGRKPTMLMLIQYRCTNLCQSQIQVLMAALKELKFTPGKEFQLLIVSIDPREGPELAREMEKAALAEYGRPEAAVGWHWLTGNQKAIDTLADAIGFRYFYDKQTDQFAHPDGVIITTPEGKVARYFFSLSYPSSGLRLALVEAARGKIGTALDVIALLCFHYNPVTGKYAVAVFRLVQWGAIVTVLSLAIGVGLLKSRERGARVAWR